MVVGLLDPEQLDLVVGRLLAVGGANRVDPDERPGRDVLETNLGVVGEPVEHRLPVAGADALVERANVRLQQVAPRRHTSRFWSSHVRTPT